MSLKMNITLLALFISSIGMATEFKDTLIEKQWALSNQGQIILRDTGDFTRDHVPGVKGADLNFYNPQNFPADKEVVVAVIDSGVDVNHPDLKGRIYFNKELCQEKEDNSKKPCSGINAMDKNLDISDDFGHGTHVAGIIAANRNDIGVAGIAPAPVKIMPIKVFNKATDGYIYNRRYVTDIFADAIAFAITNGADVINMSLGFPKLIRTPKFKAALQKAVEKGIPVVVAAGNNNKDLPVYPCSSKGVICVGAVTNTGKIAEFSNFGGKVDILAPGHFIVSTYPTAQCPILMPEGSNDPCLQKSVESRLMRTFGYEVKKGTSQAAPYISGIVATMKLVNPELTLNQIKARLFASARSVKEAGIDDKFTKYGLVDMKRAVTEEVSSFVTPIYKELTDIEINPSNGNFIFNLPIESLAKAEKNVKVTLSFQSENIKLSQSEFTIKKIRADKPSNIIVQGQVQDLTQDAYQILTVKIETEDGFSQSTSNNMIFNLNIKKSKTLERLAVPGVHVRKLALIDPRAKRLFMRKVSNQFKLGAEPEYFILDTKKQTKDKTVITLMEIKSKKVLVRDLEIPKALKVIGIFKADIDQNGTLDFFVYSMSESKENLVFSLFNQDLTPLFNGNNDFNLPITSRWELPVKNSYQEDFYWMNLKTKDFGNILVPAVYASFLLPDEDNTDDILDEKPRVASNHLFYHLPRLVDGKVMLSLRAVDSYEFSEKLRKEVKAPYFHELVIEKPFVQNKEDFLKGKIRTLVSTGREFSKTYFKMNLDSSLEMTIEKLGQLDSYIAGNNLFPMIDLEDNLGATRTQAFVALNSRNSSRVFYMDQNGGDRSSFDLSTGQWSDPIFNFAGIFNDPARTTFIESRYYVHGRGNYGLQHLPVYRESSFPGVKFSETMAPVMVSQNGGKLPGLFMDSTLIFGDRLYSIISTEEGIKRPISLSLQVPASCIRMSPEVDTEKGESYYLMLCGERSGRASIYKYPMAL